MRINNNFPQPNFKQMTYLNKGKPIAVKCSKVGKWRKFIHPVYLNCATFEPRRELRHFTTNIEMYMYLGEMLNLASCPDCFHGDIRSQLSGALTVIHPTDQLPDINLRSINLKPGSLTEIKLTIVENVQRLPPYGRCSMDVPRMLPLYEENYEYTEHACHEYKRQTNILRTCGCYSLEYPYNAKLGYPGCNRLPSFINKSSCTVSQLIGSDNASVSQTCFEELQNFTDRMLCKRKAVEGIMNDDSETCNVPCSFYSYEAEQSISTWPTKSWQLTWLNSSFVRQHALFKGHEFDIYRKAQRLQSQGKDAEASRLLESTTLLERNLLALLIDRPNFDVRKVEEKEVLSITSFMSQTGGLFSIWIGLSMISLGEVFELLMRCYVQAKKRRTTSAMAKEHGSMDHYQCKTQSNNNLPSNMSMNDFISRVLKWSDQEGYDSQQKLSLTALIGCLEHICLPLTCDNCKQIRLNHMKECILADIAHNSHKFGSLHPTTDGHNSCECSTSPVQ